MIALFDSGVGGLHLLETFRKRLPNHDFLYLADNARCPYGNHGLEAITKFTEQGVRFLIEQGATSIVFACNTVCAAALPYIQKKYGDSVMIFGIIEPIVDYVLSQEKLTRVGVIATRATIYSNMYEESFHKKNKDVQIVSKACPLLVPLIEEDFTDHPITKKILKYYLKPVKDHNVDTLILGCTHYFAAEKHIKRVMGKRVVVPPITDMIAETFAEQLQSTPETSKQGSLTVYCTDPTDHFAEIGERIIGAPFTPETTDLDAYEI